MVVSEFREVQEAVNKGGLMENFGKAIGKKIEKRAKMEREALE